MNSVLKRWAEIRRYPSAIAGMMIILALVALSVYTVFAIPYRQAIQLWRGGENLWIENPRNAAPAWFNLFPGINLPTTMVIESQGSPERKAALDLDGLKEVRIELPVSFTFDGFPKEISLFFFGALPDS